MRQLTEVERGEMLGVAQLAALVGRRPREKRTPCGRRASHPQDDKRSFMESSQPPSPFDQQGLVALYLLRSAAPSAGTP